MTQWLALDDQFPEHPKILGLSDRAFRLHVMALCYAHRHMTDGAIPPLWVPGRLARSVRELETGNLWEPNGSGWVIHDYLAWQYSRAQIEARRQQRSKAGSLGAQKRWGPTESQERKEQQS